MEEKIADIKSENEGKILSSGEMLQSLERKGLLTLSSNGVMKGTIISGKISDLIVGYNGDVYLKNYNYKDN